MRSVIDDRCLGAVAAGFVADRVLGADFAALALLAADADAPRVAPDAVRPTVPVFFFPLMVYKYFEIKKIMPCK